MKVTAPKLCNLAPQKHKNAIICQNTSGVHMDTCTHIIHTHFLKCISMAQQETLNDEGGGNGGQKGNASLQPERSHAAMPPLLWLDAAGWQLKYGHCAFSKGLISTLASFPFCQQQKADRQQRSASVPPGRHHLGGLPVPCGTPRRAAQDLPPSSPFLPYRGLHLEMTEKLIFLSEEQVMLLGPNLFRKVGRKAFKSWGNGVGAQMLQVWAPWAGATQKGTRDSKGRLTRGSVEGKMATAVILHVFVLA